MFDSKYWFLFLLLLLGFSVGVVWIQYFRNKSVNALTGIQKKVLIGLRFLSVFLIGFLLLSPFVKSLKKISQNPIIVAAWDNSGSVVSFADSAATASGIVALKNKIDSRLGTKFSVVDYSFGEKLQRAGKLQFSERKSDYSGMISAIINNHFNENIGALIIAGDGIYNEGKNPVNLLSDIRFPVYTIGLGDTTVVSDARIDNVRTNRTAFSGNKFPVEVDVYFSKLKGKTLKLTVNRGNVVLAENVITPPNDDYFCTRQFILDAGTQGLKHFSVQVESVRSERNTKNNSSGFVVNVLENKQKILILSDGPHPDIGAITNTLELQKTYDVSVFTEEPYPSDLSVFNLLILDQLPTAGKSVGGVLKKAAAIRLPVLFLVGNKTFLPQLNALKQGVAITSLAGSDEDAQATFNPTYVTFNLSDELKDILPKLPPLQVPFANFVLEPGFMPLFYQKIKNIETAKPLIATGILNGRKTGFIFGEGIWKWRLYNFLFTRGNTQFNELINQLIQYLALRENEDNFIVDFKPVYSELDNVIMNAEVYNDAYQPVESQEVTIALVREDGKSGETFNFTFDVQGKGYYLNAGKLPVGDYDFTAKVMLGTDKFLEQGKFTIVPVNRENLIAQANHKPLYQLAVRSDGNFFLPSQAARLIDEIMSNTALKPTVFFQQMVNELLNMKVLFFVLLLLLTVEWFLIKFWGIY